MKLDPRTKMVMIVCITTLAIIYNTPGRLLLLLTGTLLLLLAFRIDPGSVWKYLRPLIFLSLMLFLVQIVFSPGAGAPSEVLLAAGRVPLVSGRGLAEGASVVLRLWVVVAAAVLLTTGSSRDFVLGLVQWKIPYEIAFMVSVAIRFLPVFRDELVNVVTAVQLRGVELKKVPWRQRIGLYRSLLFPVVYGAMLKAQQLSEAMEARGFRAYPQRTCLRRLKLSFADHVLMLFFPASALLLIWLQFKCG